MQVLLLVKRMFFGFLCCITATGAWFFALFDLLMPKLSDGKPSIPENPAISPFW
jgi:hypothetical protein